MGIVNYTKLVEKKAGADLEKGEVVRVGLLCKPRGIIRRVVVKRLVGDTVDLASNVLNSVAATAAEAAGEALNSAMEPAEGAEGTKASTFPTSAEVILAATDRRIVVFEQKFGAWSPNLKLYVSYGPSEIAELRLDQGVAMRKMEIVFADASAAKMDLPRGQGDPTTLVAAFEAMRSAARS